MNPLLHSAFSPIISSTVVKESRFKMPFKQNKVKNAYTDCVSHLLPLDGAGNMVAFVDWKPVVDIFANV